MRIVFFGTSYFAARILDFIVTLPFEIAAVVTKPDRLQGRSMRLTPTPVKAKAVELGLAVPVFQPLKASTEEFASVLRDLHADLFVVVAYGEIIKQNLLDIPLLGCINIHASLLPKYRGAAPMQRCLMNGDKKTGITIIRMVLALDAGPMLEKEIVPISDNMTFGELQEDLIKAACTALQRAIEALVDHRAAEEVQNELEVTYAPKINPQEERIDWAKSADQIHHLICALSPRPGAWCYVRLGSDIKRMQIKRSLVHAELQGLPGEVLENSELKLIIACGEGALELLEVQLEGKKTLSVIQFLRGLRQPLTTLNTDPRK